MKRSMKKVLAALAFAGTVVVTVCASADPCLPSVSDCPGHTGGPLPSTASRPVCAPTHQPTATECDEAYALAAPPPTVIDTTGDRITLQSPRPPRPRPRRVTVSGRDGFARSEIRRVEIRLNESNGATNRNFANVDAMLEAARRLTYEATSPLTTEVVRIEQAASSAAQQSTTANTNANAALAADAAEFTLSGAYGLVLGGSDFGGLQVGAGWRHRFSPKLATIIRGAYGMGTQTATNGHGPLHFGSAAALLLLGSDPVVQGLVGLGGSFGGYIGHPNPGELGGFGHMTLRVEGGLRINLGSVVAIEILLNAGTGTVTRVVNGQSSDHSGVAFGGTAGLVFRTN